MIVSGDLLLDVDNSYTEVLSIALMAGGALALAVGVMMGISLPLSARRR
jgi:hypothetical protein